MAMTPPNGRHTRRCLASHPTRSDNRTWGWRCRSIATRYGTRAWRRASLTVWSTSSPSPCHSIMAPTSAPSALIPPWCLATSQTSRCLWRSGLRLRRRPSRARGSPVSSSACRARCRRPSVSSSVQPQDHIARAISSRPSCRCGELTTTSVRMTRSRCRRVSTAPRLPESPRGGSNAVRPTPQPPRRAR